MIFPGGFIVRWLRVNCGQAQAFKPDVIQRLLCLAIRRALIQNFQDDGAVSLDTLQVHLEARQARETGVESGEFFVSGT